MFGTLIVELPCTYQGAKLSVFDPEDGAGREQWAGAANENPTHEYCWAGESEEGIRFTAFYADCFHCVDTLTSGSRVALNYCLLSLEPDPKGRKLSDKLAFPDAIPPQPARTGLIDELADAMTTHFFRYVPLPAVIRPHERHPFPTVTTTQRGRRGAVPTPLLRCAEPPICEWGGVAGTSGMQLPLRITWLTWAPLPEPPLPVPPSLHSQTLRSLKHGLELLKGRDRGLVNLLHLASARIKERQLEALAAEGNTVLPLAQLCARYAVNGAELASAAANDPMLLDVLAR